MTISRHRLALLAGTATAALAAAPALAQVIAQTIAAPAGDAGFWAGVNGWLSPVAATWVAGAATWGVAKFGRRAAVADRAALTADVRETATTGLFLAAHEMEVEIDRALPMEKRQELIVRAVDWVLQRLPGPLGRLGFAEPVVRAIVIKMLGQIVRGWAAEGQAVVDAARPQIPVVDVTAVEAAATGALAAVADHLGDRLSTAEAAVGGLAAGLLPRPGA